MKKSIARVLSLVLVLIMVVSAMPVSAMSGISDGSGRDIRDWWRDLWKWWVKPTPIEVIDYPAQRFRAELDGGLVVSVEAPEGALPVKTKMTAERVTDIEAVQAAVNAMDGVSCNVKVAVDITFTCGKTEVQPSKDVTVTMKCDELSNIANLTVVHLDADIDGLDGSVDVETVDDAELNGSVASFSARHFSIYAGGDGENNTRVTVDFYPNETITDSNRNNRQIVLVSSFTGGNTPVYDPGLPNLGANQAFGGWKLVGSGTAPAGFEYGKTYTVNQLNEILIANAESYTSAFTLSFAAVVEDVVFVSYTDQNGVVWKTEAVPLNHSTYGDFTYDSDNFAPEGQNVGLVGWVVMFENGQATGYVVEDTDDAADFKYKVVDNAPFGAPGSAGTASHELVLYPLVKAGHWIYFNANIGTNANTEDTTPASYTAPRFVAEGYPASSVKPADPTREGYYFDKWYTTASHTTEFNWNQEVTADVTVYANWTPKSNVPYKIIFWTQNRNDETGLSNANKTWDYYVPTASGVVTSGTASAGSTVTLPSSTTNKTAYNRLGRNDETYSGRAANGELGYYFKFNSAMTETSKVIRGDGTTVFNVYYDRATLTIKFYNSSSASTAQYTYSGLYEHDWDGYPSLSSSYTWKYDDPNDNKTYILTSGTAPTVFKSFQSCTETWNIYRADASSWNYSSPIYYRRQALNGSYVLYREDDLCVDSSSVYETQYIRGNEFFGFTGVGYNMSTDSTTASSYHTFTANDSGDYPLIFTGYEIYSYGINIYYQRNQWAFDYYSNGTTYHANNGNKIYFEDDISSLKNFEPTNGPEGYYFTGWYKDPECTKPYTFSGTEAKMPNNDVIVYAGWEPEWYRIVFDLTDGGNVDPTTIVIPSDDTHPNGQDPTFTVVYGTKIDGACLSKVTTTTGLTFGGWFYDAAHTKPFSFETLIGPNIPSAGDPDGMDMSYATADASDRQDQSNYWKPWSDVDYPAVRGKLVLYPLWRQKVVGSDGIQVRYDAVDGDGLIYVGQDGQVIRYDPFTYTDGALAFTRYSATPNENGEQFLYWEILDKNGNVVDTVYPGETFPVNLEWAVAEPTRPTYTITWYYRDDNGNWVTKHTNVFEGDIPTSSAPNWDDGTYLYEFSSWNSAQDGSGTAPVAADANADYYAQYTQAALPAKYTVTFKDWDDTILNTQTVYEGYAATAPADPTRTGYTFTGWSPADFSNVTSDMTITAQYTVNSYTLTINYVDDDNNAVHTAYTHSYEFGASYSVDSPEVEGYTTEQTTVAGTMPAQNVTVNVVYTATSTVKVYELVTTAPSDWSGNYVITYGNTTDMYIMKGVAGSPSGTDIESASNATAYASSGITLDGTKLKNVADDYVFTIAPSGSYYSVKSVSQGSYLGQLNDTYHTLAAYSALNTTYCLWTPGVGTDASSFSNTSSTNYPYLSFYPSGSYFWTGSTTNTAYTSVRLWKETTESGSSTPSVTWTQVTGLTSGSAYGLEAGRYYRFEAGGYAISNTTGTTITRAASDATDSKQWWLATSETTVGTHTMVLLKNVSSSNYMYFTSYTPSGSSSSTTIVAGNASNGDTYDFYAASSSTVYLENYYYDSGYTTYHLGYKSDYSAYCFYGTSSSSRTAFTVYESNETFNASVQPASADSMRRDDSVNLAERTGDFTVQSQLRASEVWEPVNTVEDGGTYLIGYVEDGITYLMMNYNPSTQTYYGSTSITGYTSSRQCYAIVAQLDGSGNVTGVSTSSISGATLDNVKWTFNKVSGSTSYYIQSASNSSKYLQVYNSTTTDLRLYPDSLSANYSKWDWSETSKYLSWTYDSTTKYVSILGDSSEVPQYFAADADSDYAVEIQLYKLQENVTPTATPTATPTPTPTPTAEPTATPTAAPAAQMWTPTDTIVPGEEYLIGFVYNGVVYLAVNDGTYSSYNSNYYGYSARAVLDSDNAISAHVIGLNDINGRYTDLSSCTWTFSSDTGGLIKSTANSNYYLSTYSTTTYRDLYAQSSTSNGTGWYYDTAEYSLSRTVNGTTMYAGFFYFYTDEETNITGTNMAMYSSDPTTDDIYVQLYSLKDVVEGETYTVTFSYYDENGDYVTETHENVAYGAEITPPEVPERPGYTFDGWDSEGYLGVTESHDYVAQYIQDGSVTYTVYLRAVYGEKNTTGTTTIVLDANGLTFASGANDTLQGLGWSGFASTNETRTMGNLDINASVRIPAGQIFAEYEQAGYTFLGWNTKPDGTGLNFSVSGSGENDFGGATEKTVYVDNLDRTSVNTHVNTLYAMWEGSAMFYHSADNTLENSSGTRIFSTYERQNTGVDITAMVKTGCLYGGYYSDYAGKGSYSYGNIGSGYEAYDGTQVAWTESNAYTAIKGNAFNFQSGSAAKTYIGKTIFIKEVPASTYLRPYLHFTYKLDENQTIMNAWLISDVDDLNYNGTGFIIVNEQYGTTKVVSKLTVTTSGGVETTQTLTPESVFNAKGAKNRLTYREVIGGASLLNEGDMVYNYWITPDGLRVTGARVCQYYNLGSAKNIDVTNNDEIGSLITDPSETH
ncbi:MAG: InlB B-repeat-containing protein [Clostridia bacterium]|nr:InlB B-repeat-containing protein [Clostridia bacterium]